MNLPENNPANDAQQSNDDSLDLTTPNDNQELDSINAAVQAAEPSFTLNYETDSTSDGADESEPGDKDTKH